MEAVLVYEELHIYNNLAAYYVKHGEPEKATENALICMKLDANIYQAMSAADLQPKIEDIFRIWEME